MRLDEFDNAGFDRGASRLRESLWIVASGVLVASWMPGSAWRRAILRAFGARIGTGVVIKPGVTVKFPWRLSVGGHCWIGEGVWIDNLAHVSVGSHVCISQGAYLCTGSHDWTRTGFDLLVRPIRIADHVWVAAMGRIAPGTSIEEGAVLCLGSVAQGRLTSWGIHAGMPARRVRDRVSAGNASNARIAGAGAGIAETEVS